MKSSRDLQRVKILGKQLRFTPFGKFLLNSNLRHLDFNYRQLMILILMFLTVYGSSQIYKRLGSSTIPQTYIQTAYITHISDERTRTGHVKNQLASLEQNENVFKNALRKMAFVEKKRAVLLSKTGFELTRLIIKF